LRPPDGRENTLMSPVVDLSPVVDIAALAAHKTLPPLVLAVTVDFDKSVLIQMALFATLIIVLKPLLLDPMLRVFALREERTEGAKGEARGMQERAAEILSNYESAVAKARDEALTQRDQLRKETAVLEAQILAEARSSADTIVSEGRMRIDQEMLEMETQLKSHGETVAKLVGGHLIGRELSS
jgi:F-type H+-transporting ATPase subunit b